MNKHNEIINTRQIIAQIILEVIDEGKTLKSFSEYNIKDIDLSFVQNTVYGSLRHLSAIEIIIKKLLTKSLKGNMRLVHALLIQAIYQLCYMDKADHAAVFETVEVAKKLKGNSMGSLTNAVLRNFIRKKEEFLKLVATNHLHPNWFTNYLNEHYNKEQIKAIINANNSHPPLWIRVNVNRIDPNEYIKLLANENIEYEQHNSLKQAIKIINPIKIQKIPGFYEGLFFVQDIHAQLAALILEPNNQQSILDCCAAPGGKTTHILELAPESKVVAIDINEKRLKRIEENLQRLQQNATLLLLDATKTNESLEEKFDLILLDVPCSATGVIRRHPDKKWIHKNINDFNNLKIVQQEILSNNLKLLKKGGKLLYITCSILPKENREVISNFINNNKEIQLVSLEEFAKKHKLNYAFADCGLQLLPDPNSGDGFYFALMTYK